MRNANLLPVATGAVFLTASTAHADIRLPDTKYVTHLLRFDDIRTYSAKYRFFVVGKRSDGAVSALKVESRGEVQYGFNPLYLNQGPYLYAVPKTLADTRKDGEPSDKWFNDKTPGVLRSDSLVRPIRTTRSSDPHDTYLTRYKIIIKPAPTESSKPVPPTLVVIRMSDGWIEPGKTAQRSQDGLLLGISTLSCLGLVGRLRSRRRRL